MLSRDRDRRDRVGAELVFPGAELGFRPHRLVPGDGLAAVDGFPADDARQSRLGDGLGLVDWRAGQDAGDQVLVLLVVGAR